MITKASVVGLGKLGLCQAAVLAERGFRVKGVDIDERKVAALNGGPCPIYEPKLGGMLKANTDRLSGTKDYKEAIANSDITFVIVPTPSGPSGGFSLKYVLHAVENIGRAIRLKRDRHLVVVTSTVMPGSMDNDIRPTLETSTGLKCPRDVGLCYNPEFIALGDVINGMLSPDLILIGESDKQSGQVLQEVQKRICKNSPEIARMNFINAELSKISVNSFVTMKMSFANTLAEICEKLPGADVDTVTRTIGSDKRIGRKYLTGATGYGGPCFPRDNLAFASLAKRLGAQAQLALSTHEVNTRQIARILHLAEEAEPRRGTRISVLGLSYKPDTNVVEESQGVEVCKELSRLGYEVHAHDPAAIENARMVLGPSVKFSATAEEAIRESEVCILMTPWNEYKTLRPSLLKGRTVVDVWRILPQTRSVALKYVQVGSRAESDRPPDLSWQ